MSKLNEQAKQNLKSFGYLDQVLFAQTQKELLINRISWKTEEEKVKVYQNCIDFLVDKGVEMYVVIGDSALLKHNKDKTREQIDIILNIGETKRGDRLVLATPYEKIFETIEYKKKIWMDNKPFSFHFDYYKGIFDKGKRKHKHIKILNKESNDTPTSRQTNNYEKNLDLKTELKKPLKNLCNFMVTLHLIITLDDETRMKEILIPLKGLIDALGAYIYGTYKKREIFSFVMIVSTVALKLHSVRKGAKLINGIKSELANIEDLLTQDDMKNINLQPSGFPDFFKETKEIRAIKTIFWRIGASIVIFNSNNINDPALEDILNQLLDLCGEYTYRSRDIKTVLKKSEGFKKILGKKSGTSKVHQAVIEQAKKTLNHIVEFSKMKEQGEFL